MSIEENKSYCTVKIGSEAVGKNNDLIDAEKNTVKLSYKRNYYNIKIESIQYIKAYSGETEFKVNDHLFRKKVSLNDMEKYLAGKSFFRVNKSYMVNIEKITDYKDETIFIQDKKIQVSRRKKKEFEKVYMEYKLKDCIVT